MLCIVLDKLWKLKVKIMPYSPFRKKFCQILKQQKNLLLKSSNLLMRQNALCKLNSGRTIRMQIRQCNLPVLQLCLPVFFSLRSCLLLIISICPLSPTKRNVYSEVYVSFCFLLTCLLMFKLLSLTEMNRTFLFCFIVT